jgi:predicted dehydrogenase
MKIRFGMIGGGRGAFIGGVHRIAAAIDQQAELVCGAFSSSPQKSIDSGADLGLSKERCYGNFVEMIRAEASLPKYRQMQFVSIVAPNNVHFPAAKLALEAGFHVLSDKPATFNLAQAKELAAIVKKTGKLYGVTYNYTGYPLIRQARQMIEQGKLGKIRKVVVEYPQGWLGTMIENTPDGTPGKKQGSWRVDPAICGAAGCMGDIGTHAINLAEYVTGLHLKEIAADLTIFLGKEGRRVDDDGSVLLRFASGAKGTLMASQVSTGCENDLRIRVYGELGGIEWSQLDPNTMIVTWLDQPKQIYRTSMGYLGTAAAAATRTPAGHPEGYLEGFANIYRNFMNHIRAVEAGTTPNPLDMDYPTIDDGVAGMAFIEAVVASSAKNAAWTPLDYTPTTRAKYGDATLSSDRGGLG